MLLCIMNACAWALATQLMVWRNHRLVLQSRRQLGHLRYVGTNARLTIERPAVVSALQLTIWSHAPF